MFKCRVGLVALATWALLVNFLQVCAAPVESDLVGLCNGNLDNIASLSQAEAIVVASKSSDESSCEAFENSLAKLEPILQAVRSGDICNLSFVEKVRQYHVEFITPKNDKSQENSIPLVWRQFFVALCFQVSAECKMSLINNLQVDTRDKISEEDYAAAIYDRESGPTDFDDILLPNDVRTLAGNDHQEMHMLVGTSASRKLRKMFEVCTIKFRPFYSKLILPVIELSNLGYNYHGELLERELKELNTSEFVRRWFNIVQACECFGWMELFEDTENLVGDNAAMTFIGSDEADLLRENQGSLDGNLLSSERPLTYELRSGHNLDKLWIIGQDELKKQIDKYKTNFDESHRLKSLAVKRLKAKMKASLSAGKVNLNSMDLLQCSQKRKCEAHVTNLNGKMAENLSASDSSNKSLAKKPKWDAAGNVAAGVMFLCAATLVCLVAFWAASNFFGTSL